MRERVHDHLRREHPAIAFDDRWIEEIVDARSYRYELVAVYAGGVAADEDFGPDPY